MSDLEQEKKKKAENSQSSADIVLLYDRIDSLAAERDSLGRQLEASRGGAASKESDERMTNLTMLVKNFKIKQEESTLEY